MPCNGDRFNLTKFQGEGSVVYGDLWVREGSNVPVQCTGSMVQKVRGAPMNFLASHSGTVGNANKTYTAMSFFCFYCETALRRSNDRSM